MNQWNLTVRQALFASFYHTWIRHTEVLTRFTSPIDPRYVNPRACTACVYSSISLHFKFDPDREPDHVCLCNVVPTSAILRFNSWTVLRHPCLFFLRFATFSQRNVSGTRRVLKNQGLVDDNGRGFTRCTTTRCDIHLHSCPTCPTA